MERTTFAYVTYIANTAEAVWNSLLNEKMTAQYWQHRNVSSWRPGSDWEHRRTDKEGTLDLVGKVVEFFPPRRLVLLWAFPADKDNEDKNSRVTFNIEPVAGVVRVTVTHELLEPGSVMYQGIAEGWPKVLSSLKSLLEVGRALPQLW
jgi:uncharacterized protein YndB with AHSA1/START domain